MRKITRENKRNKKLKQKRRKVGGLDSEKKTEFAMWECPLLSLSPFFT